MLQNKQLALIASFEYNGDDLEFIKHTDYHLHLYYNGSITDVIYPRHKDDIEFVDYQKIESNLIYGKSIHNKTKIKKFLRESFAHLQI
jgi:hypothetical protein